MSEWLRSRLMNERGSMLLGGLVFSAVITLLGLAIFDLNVVESRLASDRAAAVQAVYAAEAGVYDAWFNMKTAGGADDFTDVFANTFSTATAIASRADLPAKLAGRSYSASYIATKCAGGAGAECDPADPTFALTPGVNGFWIKSVGTAAATAVAPAGRQATIYARYEAAGSGFPPGAVTTCGNIVIGGGGTRDTDSFDSRNGAYDPVSTCTTGCNRNDSGGDIRTLHGNISLSGNVWGEAWAGGLATESPSSGNITGSTYHVPATHPHQPPQDCRPTDPSPLPKVPACGPPYYQGTISGTGVSYDSGTGNLTVSGGNTVTLDALAAGQKYCFHNVTISPGNLNIPSNLARPLVISMTGQWNSQGGSITNQTYIPANLQIESCYGSGGSVCGSSSGNGVRLQGNSIAYAVFYAPDADITCSPCNVGGAIVGKTFNEQGGSGQVHYDIALGDTPLLIGPPGTWTRNKWVIVQGN